MVSEETIPPSNSSADYGSVGSRTDGADEPSLKDAKKQVEAAYAAGLIYVATIADRVRLAIRKTFLWAIVAIIAAVFAAGVLVTAAVLLLSGIAEGIGTLLGGRVWAGDLITGVSVVAVIVVAGWLLVSRIAHAARLQTIASYQKRKKMQP